MIKTTYTTVIILLSIVSLSGCFSSRQVKTYSELNELEGAGPIRVLTVDTLLYTFKSFTFNDSSITGIGEVHRGESTSIFNGTLPFSNVLFIEHLSVSFWKGAYMIPLSAGIAYGLATTLGKESKFDIYSAGSSCPFIYSFDGTKYHLEAEAFGTSVSTALEAQTFSVLHSLKPEDGMLKVRISNERPETHLLNSVHLYAADASDGTSVVLDVDNNLWSLSHTSAPMEASNSSGKDVLTELSQTDGTCWKSDLSHTSAFSGFRDEIDLEFQEQRDGTDVLLVVNAINTDLITEVYRSVGALLGDATLQFYHALEHDAELQKKLRAWILDCSLRIEIADGTEWKVVGVLPPEANVTPFSRAIRLRNITTTNGKLRIRLSSLTDVWRIDAVQIADAGFRLLELHPLELRACIASDGSSRAEEIARADSSYALILPPEYIDLTFDGGKTNVMRNPVYVIAAQGYLYEWFPDAKENSLFSVPTAFTADNRIALLKSLIAQKDIFLPPLYAQWKKESNRE